MHTIRYVIYLLGQPDKGLLRVGIRAFRIFHVPKTASFQFRDPLLYEALNHSDRSTPRIPQLTAIIPLKR